LIASLTCLAVELFILLVVSRLVVPPVRLSIVANRAFPEGVTGEPADVTPAESLSTFNYTKSYPLTISWTLTNVIN